MEGDTAGEGLFARKYFHEGELVAIYNGLWIISIQLCFY